MKSFVAKPGKDVKEWCVMDAREAVLGRLAAEVARRLRGKHKPVFTPHVDSGDYVVVINAAEIKVTGSKFSNKIYHRHTGYPGGIKSVNFSDLQKRYPGRAFYLAVKGMLPKGPLGRSMLKKLKIYPGEKHPHTAQMPKLVTF